MDPLRYKRPETQISKGQITQTNLGNAKQPVPKVHITRPLHAGQMQQPMRPRAPQLRTVDPNLQMSSGIGRPTQAVNNLASVAVAKHQAEAITAPRPKLPLAAQVPIDMSLPGEDSPNRFADVLLNSKYRGARRWAFRGVALSIVLIMTLGGLLFSQSYIKAHKVFKGSTETAEALKPKVNPDLLKGEGSGRVNVLLLGRGGGTHDAPDLTDTIIINSVDPVNHKAALLSLPRDMWVNVPDHGVMKLNAVWQTGVWDYLGKRVNGTTNPKAIQAGFDLLDQTITDITGMEMNYNAIINFQAFKQAVDTVGGVTIDVPNDLVDPTMAWENNKNPVLAKAGIQTMDGTRALIYARSRETTSDFARSQRQRQLMLALRTKVIDLGTLSNPLKISKLISAFGDNVQTDLSLKNAQRLYSIVKDIPETDIASIGLTDANANLLTTGNITGQSVVLPKAGLFKYDQIKDYLRIQIKDPYLVKENAKVLVLNGTLVPGLAATKSAELTKYGYNVVGNGNTPTGGWTTTTLVDLSGGKKKYTRHYLEQRMGISALTSLSDKSIVTNGADFVIIIGNDGTNSSQN